MKMRIARRKFNGVSWKFIPASYGVDVFTKNLKCSDPDSFFFVFTAPDMEKALSWADRQSYVFSTKCAPIGG